MPRMIPMDGAEQDQQTVTPPATTTTPQQQPQQAIPGVEQPTTLGGALKSAATAVRSTVEGIPSTIGDISDAEKAGVKWLLQKAGVPEEKINDVLSGFPTLEKGMMPISPWTLPRSEDVRGVTDAAVNQLPEAASSAVQDVTRHKPENFTERTIETVTPYLSALISPGTATTRLASAGVPSLLSVGAGELAHQYAPEWEGAARTGAGLLGAFGTGLVRGPKDLRTALAEEQTTPAAARKVRGIMQAEGTTPEVMADDMRNLGGNATLPDVSSVARQQAQQVQAAGGEGRAITDKYFRGREEASGPRLEAATTEAVGPQQRRSSIMDALETRKEALGPEYKAAHAGQTKAGDVQPIIDDIDTRLATVKDPEVVSALKQVKDFLTVKKTKPDQIDAYETASEPLHETRKAIDGMLYDAKGQPREMSKNKASALKDMRKQIDGVLEDVGPIKDVDVKRAQIGKEERALQVGEDIYENPKGGMGPDEWTEGYGKMTSGEQQHVLSGLNLETWRQLGISDRERSTLSKLLRGEGKWNFQKVAAVIGEDKATKLMNTIEREKVFNETYNKVVQGAKTAETLPGEGGGSGVGKAIAEAVPRVLVGGVTGGPTGAGAAAAVEGRGILAKLLKGGKPEEGGADLARMLTSEDPDQIVNALRVLQQKSGPQFSMPAVVAALQQRQQGGR